MTFFRLIFYTAVLICLATYAQAQKGEALTTHYHNEYKTFKEFIKYGELVKGDTNIDVKFYYINIEIGVDDPYVGGTVTCRFQPKINGLTSLSLSLNSSLTVDSIGGPVESFYQANDQIIISLDESYDPDDIVDLAISYHGIPVLAGGYKGLRYESHGSGEPIIATLSTPYLAHYWYPCKDGPQDKPDSMYMDITIPDEIINGQPLMAISNGVLENIIDNGDTRTFQWRHRYPIVTYYVMAAISNYVWFGEQFNGNSGETFPLDYYVFQESLNSAQTGVAGLPEVMQFFSDVFGPYPFAEEKYGMTQLGFYGAIENQTNTIQNSLSSSWFYTSVHELGHMWFGDMITLADWHHGWLNEGFATYSEALWDEHLYGFDGYKNNMLGNEFWNGGTLYLENAADTFNTFQSIFYTKGAYAVHMLRGVLGDSLFFDALTDYTQNPNFQYKNASTEDLQESFENSSGIDLEFFFEQWIYDEYWPFYYYNFAQNNNYDLSVVIYQAQEELYGYRPVFEMPVRIQVNFAGGSDTVLTIWNNEQQQQFFFTLNQEVQSVQIDPDKWILRKTLFQPNIPVNISSQSKAQVLNIYPNPFSRSVAIKITHPAEHAEIVIRDLTGRPVYEKRFAATAGKNTVLWQGTDVSGNAVEHGIYLIEVTAGKETYVRKVVFGK